MNSEKLVNNRIKRMSDRWKTKMCIACKNRLSRRKKLTIILYSAMSVRRKKIRFGGYEITAAPFRKY